MKLTIEHLTPAAPNFYQLIGPFAMSAEVVKYFEGYPLITGDDWHWFLAFKGSKVIGFCAYYNRNGKIRFENAYVDADYRKNGAYKDLYEARMKYIEQHEQFSQITCIATHLSTPYLQKMGFQVKRERVKWNDMVYNKPASDNG